MYNAGRLWNCHDTIAVLSRGMAMNRNLRFLRLLTIGIDLRVGPLNAGGKWFCEELCMQCDTDEMRGGEGRKRGTETERDEGGGDHALE